FGPTIGGAIDGIRVCATSRSDQGWKVRGRARMTGGLEDPPTIPTDLKPAYKCVAPRIRAISSLTSRSDVSRTMVRTDSPRAPAAASATAAGTALETAEVTVA